MKLVFFGSPETSRISLEKLYASDFSIELVITQPDRPAGRGKKLAVSPVKQFALEKGLPVIQPLRIRRDPEVLGRIESVRPDLNVVVAYGQIMPGSIIYAPPLNTINLHFSLLPLYRGASPVQWAILRGETDTGLTVFELDKKMDEGPILTQKEMSIQPEENALELEQRLAIAGADLLLETITSIGSIEYTTQDHDQATYAPLIKKEDGKIDWNHSAQHIDRQVRAFFPWPSAFTTFRGQRMKLIRGKCDESKTIPDSIPGRIEDIRKDGLLVGCGDARNYFIRELQPENKKAMSAYAFSLGAKIQPGEYFGSLQ